MKEAHCVLLLKHKRGMGWREKGERDLCIILISGFWEMSWELHWKGGRDCGVGGHGWRGGGMIVHAHVESP